MTTRRSVIANVVRVFAAATLILGFAAVNTAHADPGGAGNFVSIFKKYGLYTCYYDLAQSDGRGDRQAELDKGLAWNWNLFIFTGDVAPLNQMNRLQIFQCAWDTGDIV